MKILFSLFSAILVLTCDGTKSPKISIKTGHRGNIAKLGDTLKLSIVTSLEKDYQVSYFLNDKPISLTNEKSVFMHCLPAKIGSEVSEDVIKGEKSIVLAQARNRLVAQKGILKWLSI